jgi:hypothetical protein
MPGLDSVYDGQMTSSGPPPCPPCPPCETSSSPERTRPRTRFRLRSFLIVLRYLRLTPDGGITRNPARGGTSLNVVSTEDHGSNGASPYRIKNRVRVRLGNEEELGGSRAIAEQNSFFWAGELSVPEQSVRGSRLRSSQEGLESRNRSPIEEGRINRSILANEVGGGGSIPQFDVCR